MPEQNELTSQIAITLDGQDVPQDVMSRLVSVIVEQHSLLPDMFTLTFFDSDMSLLDGGPFDLTKSIAIAAENADGETVKLLEGEITALSPEFDEGMIARLVVEGYDPSHRLYRETRTKAYINKKDSDLADEIASAAGLGTQIESTAIVYDHIFQHNQTDLEFLRERAWRIGFECFVKEGDLFFRKPPAPQPEITLAWGQDLKTFAPRMTLAEQVDEVIVRGWDVQNVNAIVGRATNGTRYPEVEESRNGAAWAQGFGAGKKTIVDLPVVSQSEADALAAARLDEISGAFIEADGEAFRRPDISAGKFIQLEGLGARFSGKYQVTSARHVYSPEGLTTAFTVRGSRAGLLQDQFGADPEPQRYPGVVTAVVTNTEDPSAWGRVKLKFPWMADDAESDWARFAAPGAGPEAGFTCLPEVGDEVLVAFDHGDFSRPVVIGALWNGQAALPPPTAGAGSDEKALVRTWQSRSGHWMAMYDDAKNKMEIETAGGHNITFDDAGKKLTITSSGGLKIELDDNSSKITIESGNEIEIKSTGSMKLDAGGNLDLKATGQVNVQGATVNIN